MAIHATTTTASIHQPRSFRAAGPCAVLTSAEVVVRTADAPELPPEPLISADVPLAGKCWLMSTDDLSHVDISMPLARPDTAPSRATVTQTSEPLLPPPSPLPSLTTAFSRRRAIFGAVALAAAPVAALPAMSAEMLPNGAASVLSTNNARLVALADAYEELERRCNAHTAAHRGSDRDEAEDDFNALTEGFGPIEDEMAETPADTMAGVLAKARACQVRTLRQCAKEDVLLSAADDLHRLFGGGARV